MHKPLVRIKTTLPPNDRLGLPTFEPTDFFCIPEHVCQRDDLSLKFLICQEVRKSKFRSWAGGQHRALHYEGDEIASVPDSVRRIVADLQAAFGIVASAVRLIFYRCGDDYKELHRDRGRDVNGVPTYAVGLSLGAKWNE